MPLIAIPAIDVLDHNVVQLVGGDAETKQFSLPDIMEVARSWVSKGAPRLHLVDLDGAFGRSNNLRAFTDIARGVDVPVQIGGGIRDIDTIDKLVSSGVKGIILGTKAIREPEWLRMVADRHPGRIVLGMDTKGDCIAIKGWQESSQMNVQDMFKVIEDMPLAGVLNTNIDVEGRLGGVNLEKAREFIEGCPHPVISSGGITTEDDMLALKDCGAMAGVVGLALYTGMIRPWEWAVPWHV